MKLIHETPGGKYSANATGVGERNKSTAQKRHLVNNIVWTVKKNIKRKAARSFSPRYLSVFRLPLSHGEGHQQTATHLLAVFQCFHHRHPGTFSAWRQRSSLRLLAEAGRRFGCEGPRAGAVLLAMPWLLPLGMGMGFAKGPLCKGTG